MVGRKKGGHNQDRAIICDMCGNTTTIKVSVSKTCPACRKIRFNEYHKEYARRKRITGNTNVNEITGNLGGS